MVRIDEETSLGVAIATDGNGRYAKLDPYAGAQLALAEAYRNVAASGAKPLAVSDCLNFGSPEDPAVMWQFAEATRGLADACQTWAPRSPAATSRSTTRPARRRSTRPRSSPCSASSTTSTRRTPIAFAEEGQLLYLLGDTARGARRLGLVAGRPRPPRRAAAEGGPGARAAARRDPDLRLPRRHDRRRARPVRRRPDPGAWSSPACAAARARGSSCPDGLDAFVLPLLRVGGPRGRRRPAQRGAPLHRHVRRAGPAATRIGVVDGDDDRRPGRSSASR